MAGVAGDRRAHNPKNEIEVKNRVLVEEEADVRRIKGQLNETNKQSARAGFRRLTTLCFDSPDLRDVHILPRSRRLQMWRLGCWRPAQKGTGRGYFFARVLFKGTLVWGPV